MIPRLSSRSERKDGRGKSFRGLSAYLFHGEVGKASGDRVTFAETMNCHASDPSQAWAEMAWTCQHADELKAAAGVRRGGQRNDHPVWHVSLNWRDDQKPTQAQMMDAARGVLQRFGLADHQALAIAHGDTAHDHLHLMVNLVNPQDGRTVDVSRSTKYRLSAWALDYEKEHGAVLCQQRQENWKAREGTKSMRGLWTAMAAQRPELGPAKQDRVYGKSDSRPLWQLKRQAADLGLSAENIAKFGGQFRQAWDALFGEHRAAAAAPIERPAADQPSVILNRIMNVQSTFTREDLARAVNVVTKDAEAFTTLFHQVLAKPEVQVLPGAGSKLRYSTADMVRAEAEMQQAADSLQASYRHGIRDAVRSVIAPPKHLSDEQRAALEHVTDAGGIACVVGYAGTGKSTMLGAARQLWEASGYTVRGFALSGIAAEGLEGGSGIRSRTVASLEWSLANDKAKLTAKDVLVIDEAGMIGSRQLHKILTAAEKAGSKVVLVGDPAQLQAIEAGGAFRTLLERVGAARLETIRRQDSEFDRTVAKAFAIGDIDKAVDLCLQNGRVGTYERKDQAIGVMVGAWLADRQASKSSLMLAATKKDVAILNFAARQQMRDAGLLGDDIRIVARAESIDEPATDFHLRVARGDRLLFTKNDRNLTVKNGTLGTFEGVEDEKLVIRLDDDRLVRVDLTTYRNFAYGYALTVHKSQGVTVDRAHVLFGRNMDRHTAYVAMTRHRETAHLHYSLTDAKNSLVLKRSLKRDRSKDTTLDYTRPKAPPARDAAAERAARRDLTKSLYGAMVLSGKGAAKTQFRTQAVRGKWKASDFGRER